MDFNFNEEQQLLADTLRRFVRESYSFETRRGILASPRGWSRQIWQRLAELGITALAIPERYGGLSTGAAASAVDVMLAMNALGEGLVLEPYLATAVIVPGLLTHLGDENASAELLPAIAAGERIIVLAHQESGTRGELDRVATRAKTGDGYYILDGHKSVIMHGDTADEWLISARSAGEDDARSVGGDRSENGISIFRVDPETPGVKLTGYRTLDGQRAADIELKHVKIPAHRRVGAEGQAFAAIEAAHELGISALCAEAVGIMKALVAATVDYTRNRKQFGVAIASFQVLQHRMADMFLHSEQALSMSYLAAIRCTDADSGERRRALSAAKALIGQAGRYIGQQAIQLHGGMGMTDELIIGHYFKRLTAIDLSFGDTDYHIQRFIQAGSS
ncbi:acyl-CoA dehydrogenase [Steroidobacter denitrificans]|uniref:Acyl-CoA dehydrogenase n=1 Tax=Steroidobacter denitrificans TaxID=465721 RepID=A0A127F9S0_STEDE|nr:acyl-CoA dehydrogenase family protein [Steroidobacter denitrificans]AMN47164.1 acyl-CoA dehydrogenase [Steroidobacter denitrificans]